MAEDPIVHLEDEAGEVWDALRQDLLGRDGYLVVLILTLVSMVAIPIDEEFRGGSVLTAVILGLLVTVTMSRSRVPGWTRRLAAVVVSFSVALAVADAIQGIRPDDVGLSLERAWVRGLAAGSYTLVLALCLPAILRRVLSRDKITLNTVAASLAAYLLIGLVFASAFRCVDLIHQPFFRQHPVDSFTYVYFSFITLTTVGYGDFVPAYDAGRTMAMLEALSGQMFLIVIVARVVSNLGQYPARFRASAAGDSPATS
jgi:Ion channel